MFDIWQWIDNLAVSEDTRKLLQELVKRREKERQLQVRLWLLSGINILIAVMILFWLMKISAASHASVLSILDYFSSSKASVIFLLLAASLFIFTGSVSKDHKKKKDKYDHLREEVSRKISASWKINEDSKMKDEISEVLMRERDINIRYIK